ncbi:MAG: Excinuclease subunit domain protein [Bacillales bacterium]|jgi:hypothetical protein|nr:Excinuclease subunit domain protein [Bacillales bacterium]
MKNSLRKIQDIKSEVRQLIDQNSHMEVTPETKYNIPGIYMIYIDNFSSENIIPIYIGQSKNIQNRYKAHLCEILSLNRLSYEEYKKYFFEKSSSFYEGNFKTCKIFKYMVENSCSLQNFRMIVLEEVAVNHLVDKEEEYFRRLLPSFFGFNQFNSFLKLVKLSSSNILNNKEIDNFLDELIDDIKCIYSYYEYGFTRFNFEHAFPRDLNYIRIKQEQLTNETKSKYEEAKLAINKLLKFYKLDIEVSNLIKEIEVIDASVIRLEKLLKIVTDQYNKSLDLLRSELTEKFKEKNIYANKIPINNFINSIISNEKNKFRELFYKYLNSKQCDLNFYQLFHNRIEEIEHIFKQTNIVREQFTEVLNLRERTSYKLRDNRYKMIFPSFKFDNFPLKDRNNNIRISDNKRYNLLNTCHINIYISNNGNSRSFIEKKPHIIRIDYCYINNNGIKIENEFYIENETTINCKSGIEYFEKDYYDFHSIHKIRFNITSIINKSIDNSFISIKAEFKHGINDYTIKDKNLYQISEVLHELEHLTNKETAFSIDTTESKNCLKRCVISDKTLKQNTFVANVFFKKFA